MRDPGETLETLEADPRGASSARGAATAPRLEILFHAELGRVGEIAPLDPGGDEVVLGRKSPSFHALVDGEARPLADRFVSREHLGVAWSAGRGAFKLRPVGSARQPVEVVSLDAAAPGVRVERDLEVPPGTVIALGDRVLLRLAAGRTRFAHEDRLGMIGEGEGTWALRDRVAAVARFRESVLVLGETGTGKELVARALHALVGGGPFVALNLGGLDAGVAGSELFGHVRGAFTGADRDATGAFEAARGGTVFLDEIGDAPLELQKKLLRVLEDRSFTRLGSQRQVELGCRVVAATNRPLAADLAAGQFRRDLYERLAALTVPVPPLRQRVEDVPRLFVHFLAAQARAHPALGWLFAGAGDAADPPIPLAFVVDLLRHPWPGNIRELRNHAIATAAANLGGGRFHAPALGSAAAAVAGEAADSARRRPAQARIPTVDELVAMLTACKGNVRQAAIDLGCSRYQLYRWMEARGVDPSRFRPDPGAPGSSI
jgi:two-component system nitrogen regulation response regulator GlnG